MSTPIEWIMQSSIFRAASITATTWLLILGVAGCTNTATIPLASSSGQGLDKAKDFPQVPASVTQPIEAVLGNWNGIYHCQNDHTTAYVDGEIKGTLIAGTRKH